MNETEVFFGQGTAAIMFFRLGYVPDYVRVTGLIAEDVTEWHLLMGSGNGIWTQDSDGVRLLGTNGITLVKFDDPIGSLPGTGGTPEAVEVAEFYKANGIKIDAGVPAIADGNPFAVHVHRMSAPAIYAVHDAGDNVHLYMQDSSLDFAEMGVEGGQSWLLINETNDNYAYIKSVEKPAGQSKFCRLVLAENAAGDATAAADLVDADVCFILPKHRVQSPLSGIGFMT